MSKNIFKGFKVEITQDGIHWYFYLNSGGYFAPHITDETIIKSIKRNLDFITHGNLEYIRVTKIKEQKS
jgi:hypothetical protein